MEFGKLILGRRSFKTDDEIIEFVRSSRSSPQGRVSEFMATRIFATSRQQTWLVASERNVFCVLDDVRKTGPELKWQEDLSRFIGDQADQLLSALPSKKYKSSQVVSLGREKGWLATPALFHNGDVKQGLKSFFSEAASRKGN